MTDETQSKSVDQIRDDAGSAMSAAIQCLQHGQQRIGYKTGTAAVTATGSACALLLLFSLWTVGHRNATVATVLPPYSPSATVAEPSPTVGKYWISTARGNRSKIHSIECRYHKMQRDTDGAAKRKYYDTIDQAVAAHPGCERCRSCLECD